MTQLSIVAVLIALPLSTARAMPTDSIYNDSLVQCGATYFLYWKGLEQNKKTDLAEVYRRKYEVIYAKAETVLEARGLNKESAHAYMQKHIDFILKMADSDPETVAGFKTLCDKRFPDQQ